ncbi:MAG: energy-coupled thiamine transporter ThiT [Oscillospiraceae bacterium]|nr:energy-coupled thiamine transporter ThiT [Oscillospiraceae bacterium]
MKVNTKQIAEAGIFVALSLILDYASNMLSFKLWSQGGSINLSFLPIFLFAIRNGRVKHGIELGIMVGVLSRSLAMLLAPHGIYHPLSAVLDYILIGAFLGAAGFIYKVKLDDYPELGMVICGLFALFSHIVSGVVVFYEYMPTEYFGLEMNNLWFYSVLYNSTYMIPSIIIAVFLFSLLPKSLKNPV